MHDPTLPPSIVQDYYIAIALDHVRHTLEPLLTAYELEFKRSQNDHSLVFDRFSLLITDIYTLYNQLHLPLDEENIYPENSSLAGKHVKDRLHLAFHEAVLQLLPPSFDMSRTMFYTYACTFMDGEKDRFAPHLQSFHPQELVHCDLEKDIVEHVDISTLSDAFLQRQCDEYLKQHIDGADELDYEGYDVLMREADESTAHGVETIVKQFSETCKQANILQLTPNWVSLIHIIANERYSVVSEDDVKQIFDLIREFPISKPVIEDLKIAIEKRDLFDDIRNALIKALQTRLLHLGASTTDILDQYICCIHCIKIWDPTCDILVPIIQLIEDYIQNKRMFITDGIKRNNSATKHVRREAIRAVVNKVRELLPNEDPIYVFELSELDDSAPSEDQEMMDDKPTRLKRWQRKSSDTVAMLISVCGPIENFVKGYEEKLREALLSHQGYDTDDEILKLEVLKQHFPKNTMIKCDVMVTDINESRRLDRHIHRTVQTVPEEFHVAVLSRFYWRKSDDDDEDEDDEDDDENEANNDDSIRLWPGFREAMDQYESEFKRTRASRKLQWLPSRGMVTLELEFASGIEEFRVDPISAMVISTFEQAEESAKSSKQISEETHVRESKVLDSLEFWEDKGILSLTATAVNVTSIGSCPKLSPRTKAAADVTDLRIDDIKVVSAMGDSIMAGFAMMGVNAHGTGIVNISAITEYRGKSYAMGGDPGAVTMAQFIKNFNPNLQGESLDRADKDVLNGAQTGALAKNLDHELDYLIPRMKGIKDIDFENDWKLFTIQIGSNDQCNACGKNKDDVTVEKYAGYVEAAIQRIQKEIPRTLVNLLGTFRVSQVFPLSAANPEYCRESNNNPATIRNAKECDCHLSGEWATMDELSSGYNTRLQAIAEKYKPVKGATFGVVYQPMNIDIAGFSIDLLSNMDCFHPSLKAHEWIAKVVWNNLFIPQSYKPQVYNYDSEQPIPTELSRRNVQ
ncbi:hypothetical protein DFQ28_008082 [Apophysomyces sp. BC1034]|nr:hypothetical protein DFQ28_008082 [Apophysomyces sp. BC1034]